MPGGIESIALTDDPAPDAPVDGDIFAEIPCARTRRNGIRKGGSTVGKALSCAEQGA